MADAERVDELLAEIHRIATSRLKALNVAAKHKDMIVVSAARYALLEQLVESLGTAVTNAKMTRDYKDVQEFYPDEKYNGKRFLVRRDDGGIVLGVLSKLRRVKSLPQGCLAKD